MNSGTVAALRRLGLALAVGALATGGALAASDAPGGAPGPDEAAAVASQDQPPAGAPDMGGARGPGDQGPGSGPGGAERWHHGAGSWGRGGFGGHELGMFMDRGFFAALRQLNLTPVQREQMRTLVFNAREAVRMQRANAEQSGAAQLRREDFAVLSNPGDPNYAQAVQQLKERAAERVQQAISNASDTEQKLYNVLTAEQKAQLPKVLADLKARHERRMQAMRMHRDGREAAPGSGPAASPPPQQ
jgi:Spy/CpxP family protein refolding chaperone